MLPLTPKYAHKPKILIVDGFYVAYPSLKRNRHKQGFKREKCILLWATDGITNKPVYWQFYNDIENKGIWKQFTKDIKRHKLVPEYLVHDGHPGITASCEKYLPKTKQQRCLVHLMGNMHKDLSISPKTNIAKDLKRLVLDLQKVKDTDSRKAWESKWHTYCNYSEDTVSKLRKKISVYENNIRVPSNYLSAFSVVNNAYLSSELFTYLEDSKIPNNSNAIESVNGVLREITRRHRGLNIEQKKALLSWALAFRQEQTNEQIKHQITKQEITKKTKKHTKKDTLFET